jgi:hypothetical protein
MYFVSTNNRFQPYLVGKYSLRASCGSFYTVGRPDQGIQPADQGRPVQGCKFLLSLLARLLFCADRIDSVQWGVSNVPPEMLEEILRICDEKGLQKPSCYQGDYNLVTRGMETKLLPILRAHGMSFNAFR